MAGLSDALLDYTESQAGDPSEQLYQYYLRTARNNPMPRESDTPPAADFGVYLRALIESVGDREGISGAPPNTSIPLRNAQHGFVGQVAARESPIGKWGHLLAVPGYNLAKLLAQNMPSASGVPGWLDRFGAWYGNDTLTDASPPSWESIKWGLRPFWGKD